MLSFHKFKHNSFFLSQLMYSLFIVSLCTFIVGVFSYSLIKKDATSRVIESNNEVLYQYRNTIDSFVFNDFTIMSLRLLQDVKTIPELKFYLDTTLKGNIIDILTVHEYLNRFKSLNPMIYSVAVYYKLNKLAVTTDYIRYSLNDTVNDNVVQFYDNLLKTMSEKNTSNINFIYDKGANMYNERFVSGKEIPQNVINVVRIIPGYEGATGAVVITINADILHKMIKKYTPDSLNSIMIVDETDKIVLHTDIQYIGKYVSDIIHVDNPINLNGEGGNIVTNINKVPSVLSFQTSELKKWKYVALTPMLTINSATEYIYKTIIFVSLVSLLLCLIISLFAAEYLSGPIKKIVAQCSKINYVKSPLIKNEYSFISGTLDNLTGVMREKEIEMTEIASLLRVNFLVWLLSDKVPCEKDIRRKIEVFKIHFSFEKFCIIAFVIKKKTGMLTINENEVIGYEFEKVKTRLVFEKTFNTEFSQCTLCEKDEVIIALVNFDCNIEKLIQMRSNAIEKPFNGFCHYTAFGPVITDIIEVVGTCKYTLDCLGYSYIHPDKCVFTYLEILNYGKIAFSLEIILHNFVNSLKSCDLEKSITDFHILINAIQNGNCSLQYAKNILLTIAAVVDNSLGNKETNSVKLVDYLDNFYNIVEFSVFGEELIRMELKKKLNKETSVVKEHVDTAKIYINKNIMSSQFSLEKVAREMGVSPNYLSKVFHSECEITFVDYITNLKMQQSRKLLLESEMNIEEISQQLGYSTPQYFISRFKKNFGCTPNIYRSKSKDK